MFSSNNHNQKIDILRGIAILMVVAYHYSIVAFPWALPITQFGSLGVDLFLVLSGFLIHYSFIKKENDSLDIIFFFNRRFWRIYPPYFIALVFFTAINWNLDSEQSPSLWRDFIAHLFLIHNLSNTYFFGINPSFWSLALEIQLYFIYPVFLWLIKKVSITNTIFLLVFISILFSIGDFHLWGISKVSTTFVLKRWIEWGIGAYLADKFYRQEKAFAISTTALLILIGAFVSIRFIPEIHVYIPILKYLTLVWQTYLIVALVEKCLYMKEKLPIEKILTIIGVSSYSIYLLHQPILPKLFANIRLFRLYEVSVYFVLLDAIIIFLLTFLISYSFYLFVEVTSIKFGGQFYKKYLSSSVRRIKQAK